MNNDRRNELHALGMTLMHFAVFADVSLSTVNKWIRGAELSPRITAKVHDGLERLRATRKSPGRVSDGSEYTPAAS